MRSAAAPFALGGIGILSLVAYLGFSAPMPGELSSAHARVDALQGIENCDSCHGSDGFTSRCLRCHEAIAAQLEAKRGYHHALWRDGERDCAACHGEHYGSGFALVNAGSWKGRDPDAFEHDHVTFRLTGAHRGLGCPACHVPERAATWPTALGADAPRTTSFLGLTQECSRCHVDVHGPSTSDQCSTCHDQTVFRPASGFDHAARFSLDGAHASLDCAACHEGINPLAKGRPESLPFNGTKGRACRDCHASPHTAPNAALYGNDCAACHDTARFHDHHFAASRHPARFPLIGAHAKIACGACHGRAVPALASTSARRCRDCHANPHRPDGGAVPLENVDDCAKCHTGGGWRLVRGMKERHEKVGFPLIGAHASVACASCHRSGREFPKNVAADCTACHQSPHRTDFGRSCTACHQPGDTDWIGAARPRFSVSAHAGTGFPLTSPHAGHDCAACHSRGLGPYARRFPGRQPDRCDACHTDPHGGQFRGRSGGCVACHPGTRPSFVPARFTISDHRTFPLEGGHLAVPCIRCHQPDARTSVRQFVGTKRRCRDCHQNPHGDQFRKELSANGCRACHTSLATWRLDRASFDHTATGYPLRGAHARAACRDCHVRPASNAPVRYRGTPTDCRGCHADPHRGQLTPAGGAGCTRCHGSTTAWRDHRFDHQRHARFKLDGVHRGLDCAACHVKRTTPRGATYVHYRPLGKECKDCHAVKR